MGKDVWSMGSKIGNSIFKPKKVETLDTAASTPCEATTSHQVISPLARKLKINFFPPPHFKLVL